MATHVQESAEDCVGMVYLLTRKNDAVRSVIVREMGILKPSGNCDALNLRNTRYIAMPNGSEIMLTDAEKACSVRIHQRYRVSTDFPASRSVAPEFAADEAYRTALPFFDDTFAHFEAMKNGGGGL